MISAKKMIGNNTPYKIIIKQRNDSILADFLAMRVLYDGIGMLYADIGYKNRCSAMTVRRVLAAKGLDGVQGLHKRI